MHDDLKLGAREKVVQKMTKDGLVEENLSTGTSHKISSRAASDDFSLKDDKPARSSAGLSSSPEKARNRRYAANLRDSEEAKVDSKSAHSEASLPKEDSVAETPSQETKELTSAITDEASAPQRRSRLVDQSVRSDGQHKEAGKADAKQQKQKKQVQTEQVKKNSSRLKLDDEPSLPTRGEGVLHKAGDVTSTVAHAKVSEAEQDNSAVEAAHKSEMVAEGAVRRTGSRLYESSRVEKSKTHGRSGSYSHETERPVSKLHFKQATYEPMVQKAKVQKVQQKRQIKRQYAAGVKAAQRSGEGAAAASSAVRPSITKRLSNGAKQIVRNNKGVLVAAVSGVLAVVLLLSTVGSLGSLISGTTNAVVETTYLSSDEDIHSVENAYSAMEADLQSKIDNIERDYPGYDEYEYQVDEITHNPYQLISYFTAKYGEFTYEQVKGELAEIFTEQYKMTTQKATCSKFSTWSAVASMTEKKRQSIFSACPYGEAQFRSSRPS